MSDSPSEPLSVRHSSVGSVSDFADRESHLNVEVDADDDNNEGNANVPCRTVTLTWPGEFRSSGEVYCSSNRFRVGVPLVWDEEEGVARCRVEAPIGQQLLFRFSIDGEWQTNEDEQTMQMNGEEYNVVEVGEKDVDVSSDAGSEDGSSSRVTFDAPDKDSSSAPPTSMSRRQSIAASAHRRQSSRLQWDSSRQALVISDEKRDSEGAVVPVDDDEAARAQDGKDDDTDDTASVDGGGSGLTRTQRKNMKHRQKQKMRAHMASQQFNGVPLSSMSSTQQVTLLVNYCKQLTAQLRQKEVDWTATYFASQAQADAQRKADREELQASFREERNQWIGKIKEMQSALKTASEEKLQLQSQLAKAQSAQKLETSEKKRVQKFQTMQKGALQDLISSETGALHKEMANMQLEINALQKAKKEAEAELEQARANAQAQATQVSTLQVSIASKDRELASLAEEKDALAQQLSRSSEASNDEAKSARDELQAAQSKLAEQVRRLNEAQNERDGVVAELNDARSQLAAKQAELTAAQEAVEQAQAQYKAKEEDLRKEIARLHEANVTQHDTLMQRESELAEAQMELEHAQDKLTLQTNEHEARLAAKDEQLAQARAQFSDASGIIRRLHETTRAIRSQHDSLVSECRREMADMSQFIEQKGGRIVEAFEEQNNWLATCMRKYKKEMSERRKLHNIVQELRGNIRVFARARPLNANERNQGEGGEAVHVQPSEEADRPSNSLLLDVRGKKVPYSFDAIFGPNSTQQEVFDQIQDLVTSVLDGYNVCLFAYGQTGAGKTFTMQGSPEQPGMTIRSLDYLFKLRDERRGDFEYNFKCTALEIYNETVRDLLVSPSQHPADLKIRQAATGVYVEGLTERPVNSQEDVLALLAEATKNRRMAATDMNAQSSRSHLVLAVQVDGRSSVTGLRYLGRLSLCDLAGSERVGRSGVTGERLKEAQAINLSLSALGNCIEALQKKQSHVPYRNSKLTYILQNSLGGNAKTLMLVNVSPAASDVDETSCSLQFAQRVASVELGTASRNVGAAPPASTSEDGPAPPATPKRAAAGAAAGSAAKPRATTSSALAGKKPTATPVAKKK